MAYKPKKGGYRHNAITARGHSATRQQRAIIEHIITRSPTREEIYQLLVQLALLSSQLDDVIDDLAESED